MKSGSLILAAVALGALGAAVPAHAMELVATADVPFAFTAGGTALPAGHYELTTPDSVDDGVLALRNLDTRKVIVVGYLSRIAWQRDSRSDFVFDEVGGQQILSEIHLSNADGYVVAGAEKAAAHDRMARAQERVVAETRSPSK